MEFTGHTSRQVKTQEEQAKIHGRNDIPFKRKRRFEGFWWFKESFSSFLYNFAAANIEYYIIRIQKI